MPSASKTYRDPDYRMTFSIRTPREQRRHVREQVLLLVLLLLVALAVGVLIGVSR